MTERIGCCILLTVLLPACLSYQWKVKAVQQSAGVQMTPPRDDIPEAIDINRLKHGNHFKITNHSDDLLFVSYRESAIEINGMSYRAVPGSQRVIHSDQAAADVPIAPHSSAEVSFYEPGDTKGEGLRNKLLVKLGHTARYRIALRRPDGGVGYAVVQPTAIITPARTLDKILCYVTGIIYGGWCWFVSPWESDKAKARETAARAFGAVAADIEYVGRK